MHRSSIERLLREADVSIRQLALARGVAYSAAHKVVAGEQQLTRRTAEKWCEALRKLGIEAEWHELM